MDVIEYKLSSKNKVLISHAIWKLVETVMQKMESGQVASTILEFDHLLSYCVSDDIIICKTACQGIVVLVQNEVLSVEQGVSKLMGCMVVTRHYGAIASSICNVLSMELILFKPAGEYICPFNLEAPKHPLITVLEMKNESWRDVLNHIRPMMHHCKRELVQHHLTLLRPVFFYILCDPKLSVSEACRKTAWNIVMKMEGSVYLQIEIFQWLRTRNVEGCIDTSSRLIELAEVGDAFQYRDLCTAVVPLIASISLELLKHGGDPRQNLDMISAILDFTHVRIDNVVLCLLAEMMNITPTVYLFDIVSVASIVLGRDSCNRTVAYMFVAAIMQWMAYPSVLSSDALDVAKRMFCFIFDCALDNSLESPSPNERPIEKLWLYDSNVHFYTEIVNCTNCWCDRTLLPWLERIHKVPDYAMANFKLIVSAIFLESSKPPVVFKTLEMLVETSNKGEQILSLILYKLSYSRDIEITRALLFALPKLTGFKENVPIIVNILKTLSEGEKPLNYLAIELYIQTLTVDSRFHRHIEAAIIDLSGSDKSWHADVTCARAMQYICENHPEHGAQLVPLMSQTLNRCSGRNGGAASALVLKGISALCLAGVTETSSTWKALAPKLNSEKRSVVLIALCEFFGDLPNCPSLDLPENAAFLDEVLSKLWKHACDKKNPEIAAAAFRALASYKVENMTLEILPEKFKNLIELPEITAQVPESVKKKPKNFVPVSSNFWIVLLKNIAPSVLQHTGDLLRHYIQEELYSFRSGIYRWPQGEPLNFKYLPEKSVIRAVGEYTRRYEQCKDLEKQKIVTECLRILSHTFPKALPPVKYVLFSAASNISAETKKYGIALACHQASVSPSAKQFLEDYLTKLTSEWAGSVAEMEKCMDLYEKLNFMCRAVGSNVLAPFLEETLDSMLEKVSLEKEDSVSIFNRVMNAFAIALKDETVESDNKSLLGHTLERMMDRVDLRSKIFSSYVKAVIELPLQQVERMTLPSVWMHVPTERLKKAMKIRAELVLMKSNETPLLWMNDLIRAAICKPVVHMFLLEEMERILPLMRLEKSNPKWTLDLMSWIGKTINLPEDAESSALGYLCEILFVTVICLASTDCILLHNYTHLSSRLVRTKMFPQALASIVQTAYWKDIVPQIMDWLIYMNTTSIPRMYKCIFHNAIVCLRNEDYFEVTWAKYLSVKAPDDVL